MNSLPFAESRWEAAYAKAPTIADANTEYLTGAHGRLESILDQISAYPDIEKQLRELIYDDPDAKTGNMLETRQTQYLESLETGARTQIKSMTNQKFKSESRKAIQEDARDETLADIAQRGGQRLAAKHTLDSAQADKATQHGFVFLRNRREELSDDAHDTHDRLRPQDDDPKYDATNEDGELYEIGVAEFNGKLDDTIRFLESVVDNDRWRSLGKAAWMGARRNARFWTKKTKTTVVGMPLKNSQIDEQTTRQALRDLTAMLSDGTPPRLPSALQVEVYKDIEAYAKDPVAGIEFIVNRLRHSLTRAQLYALLEHYLENKVLPKL